MVEGTLEKDPALAIAGVDASTAGGGGGEPAAGAEALSEDTAETIPV